MILPRHVAGKQSPTLGLNRNRGEQAISGRGLNTAAGAVLQVRILPKSCRMKPPGRRAVAAFRSDQTADPQGVENCGVHIAACDCIANPGQIIAVGLPCVAEREPAMNQRLMVDLPKVS